MAELRKTLCNRDCPDACSIVAHVEDGRVVKLGGDPDHPVTDRFLCYRTNQFLDLQYGPQRITQPLLRNRQGELAPVSWDGALDYAAAALTKIRSESGPAAIFHYRSGGSLGALKHLTDHFFELFGPCTAKTGDICSGGPDAAQLLDFGDEDSNDLFDLKNARNILLWGKNPVVSSVHLVPLLKEVRAGGAGVMLIDPVHHRTASLCDRSLQPRPGGDFALAMAVAQVLFERGWIHPDAPAFCDNLDAFRQLAFARSAADLLEDADLRAEDAVEIARRLHEGPTTILVGWGMGRRINGAGIVRAVDALGAITGNVGIPGGGVSYYFKRRKAFDHDFIRAHDRAPRHILEPLFGPQVLAASDPPIRAIWITAGNPVAMLPDSQAVQRALQTREFVCVVDPLFTDSARCATLVLPTTTLLEDDDLLGSYGHHYVGVSRPVVEPPAGVKNDLQIIQALAQRVGLGDSFKGSAREWKDRMLRSEAKAAGLTLEALEEQGAQRSPLSPKVVFAGRRFPTPTGRMSLMTEAPPRERLGTDYPLSLLSVSSEKSQASQWSTLPTGPLVCTVHPEASAGLADGAVARLESALGALTVRIKHDPKQRIDVALVPKGGHLRDQRCANALVRARATDLGGGAALYDEGVRLVADPAG